MRQLPLRSDSPADPPLRAGDPLARRDRSEINLVYGEHPVGGGGVTGPRHLLLRGGRLPAEASGVSAVVRHCRDRVC